MKNILYVLLFLPIITSCNSSAKQSQEFNKEIKASSEILVPADSLADPCNISLIKNHIIVNNYKASPLVEIYDISSGKRESRFLQVGNGPSEMLMIGNIQTIKDSNAIFIADLFRKKLFKYNLNEVIANPLPTPVVIYEKPEESLLLFDKLFYTKDYLIAESRDPRGRILLLDKEGKEKGYYGAYPEKEKIDKNLNDMNNAELYASGVTVSPSLDKIALAAYSAGMIDILQIKNDKIEPIWSYTEFYPQGIMIVPMGDGEVAAHTSESVNGFTDICSTDKYVYALYSGKKLEDKTYPYGNTVYVTDWKGKETYKIKLDKSINRLIVDEKDEHIYGLSDKMDILKFKIAK